MSYVWWGTTKIAITYSRRKYITFLFIFLLFAPLSKLILSSCPPENALSKVEGGTPGFIKTETGIARFYLGVIEKLYDEKKCRANFNIVGCYFSGPQGFPASGVCISNKNVLRGVNNRVFCAKSIGCRIWSTCMRLRNNKYK